MLRIGTLWGDARQRQTKVIRSVAALNEFELALPVFSFSNKPVDFIQKFPYGKIPAFEGVDGFKLIEGTAIARYLSKVGIKVDLLGSNIKEAALIDQWIQFSEHEIATPTIGFQALIYGYGDPFTREGLDGYTKRIVRGLKHLESYLASRTSEYIVSDKLTLADLIVASTAYQASHLVLGTVERAQYPAVFTHLEKVTTDERIKEFWEKEKFVDVPLTEPSSWEDNN